MIIKARLTPKDITKALNTVRWYENYLQYKLEQLVSELAEVGIVVAQDNTYVEVDNVYKNMGDFILFEKNVSKTKTGAECILIAVGKPYIKRWESGEALVNPLLMAEFGSGWRAIPPHQGEFPNQTHAEEHKPWFWVDMNGNRHSSYGSEPSRPLFKAKQEMERKIREVAERVFST